MENETPYWENLNINRKCCKFFSKFIGKNCDIGLKGYDIYIPPYSTLSGTTSIKGVLQDFDGDYLLIKHTIKKKNYLTVLHLQDIASVSIEDA